MAITPKITPTPSNVPPFAHEFVTRMRAHEETKTNPSVRQTQAIPMLLSARYFRNGKLTLDDFIDAAVYTTYPADQGIARMIAEDIVLGREKQKVEIATDVKAERKPALSEREKRLQQVLDKIKWEQNLAKTIKKDKVRQGFDYLQELLNREDDDLYKAARHHLKDGDIVLRGISSDDGLKQQAASELRGKFGGLTSEEIESSRVIDALNDICDNASAAEQLAGRGLRGDRNVSDLFKDLAERDSNTAARALKHLEEMGALGPRKEKSFDKTLQEAIQNLSEARGYSSELGRPPDNIQDHINQAPSKYSLGDAMQFAKEIGQSTGQNYDGDVLKQYDEQFDTNKSHNVDMRQLAESATSNPHWHSLVQKKTAENIEKAESRSSPSDFLQQHLAELEKLRREIPSGKTSQTWKEAMQKVADAAVKFSPTKTHLRQTVRQCSRMGTMPSQEAIREAGGKLGMDEGEILELLSPSFRIIKQLVKQGVSDFDRLRSLIASAGLTNEQLEELADIAAESGNQSALGAIAHENLPAALGQSGARRGYGRPGPIPAPHEEKGKERVDLVFGGLLGGPATSIIRMWYTYRDQLPPELNERLRLIAKRLLIDLGMRFAKQTMGTSMLGGIQLSTTVRPFRIGDDIDLIDLEETIDHLLSEGRTDFKIVEPEDFRIAETYHGHRCFVWALDKSGSMDSAEKLGMLAISVMAGLYAVQKDDFGVVLFDHSTHIVKNVTEKKVSVDKVAAYLLEARAGGGTGAAHTMEWALKNFEETRAKEKIFILNTDMYLSDQSKCEEIASRMKQQDIKVVVIVPKTSYNRQAANALAKKSHGVVLDIGTIDELPERLLRVTNY
ncbi:MAG: VWA domain-containing protein [Candidatus Thorarchaeota archaeon]|nr:MAG: VWA domain-containing protein [Candidatus Thorarchaeota archaeon]